MRPRRLKCREISIYVPFIFTDHYKRNQTQGKKEKRPPLSEIPAPPFYSSSNMMLPSYTTRARTQPPRFEDILSVKKVIQSRHIYHRGRHLFLSARRHPFASNIHASVHTTTRGERDVHATAAMAFVAAVLFVVVRVAEACEVI